jgi:hypothetical protein
MPAAACSCRDTHGIEFGSHGSRCEALLSQTNQDCR